MSEPKKRKGWVFFGLACFALGAAVMDIVKNGTAAIIMTVVILFGKWLLGRVGNTFFDEELDAVKGFFKKTFGPSDPVKQQIWRHATEKHGGKFKNCRRPECFI